MAEVSTWAPRVTWPLAAVGLGLSGYLTYEHYSTGTQLSCPNTGVVNCLKVTTSAQSMVGPVPVALLGVLFFAGMAALCIPRAWSAGSRSLSIARVTGALGGIVTVLYLVGVEALVVHAICLWCTAVHAVTFALFVAILTAFLAMDPAVSGGTRASARRA